MKKLIAVILSLLTVIPMFAGCAKESDNKKSGPTIPVYISGEVTNFDPAYGNLDQTSQKIMSLLYEGLFKYDSNGKVVKAQAKSVKVLDNPSKKYYAIEITLKDTGWSDGIPVQAGDYIYAWKRILESDFRGEAANMLFCIKNAKKVHDGDATIDDLGITDVSSKIIRIEFEGPTNYDLFYEYLASPMLVPLREFLVGRLESDWSSNATFMVSNGPYAMRAYTAGESMTLQANSYYHGSVSAFRLSITFATTKTLDDAAVYKRFEDGEIVFDGEIPLNKRAELVKAKKVTVKDTMSMLSCIFNTKSEVVSDPDVRRALSLAVDREKIVDTLTFAKPAKGLIADGVFNTTNGKGKASFRSKGETLLNSKAKLSEAQALLADKELGEINLVVRDDEADKAVGEYLKKTWEALGFTVVLHSLGSVPYDGPNEIVLVDDQYLDAYEGKDEVYGETEDPAVKFDVILVDYTMFSTDAFANLASFAVPFAGGAMDMTTGLYELEPHISGYSNPEYDALITKAYSEKNADKRATLLHQAEKMLLEDMPIMPLVQLQSGFITNKDLVGVKTNYFGMPDFTGATLNNADKYQVGQQQQK
ncbi:MAG: peptide ABC transporter substrate-binding protein [Clostridia bacterium]|nr:peptide ABC transporter substrate-binding protein [Clostridia bacterium]